MARRLLGTNRQRERALQQALTTRVENTVALAFQRQIVTTMNQAADIVRDGGSPVAAVQANSENMRRLLVRTYDAAGTVLASRLLNQLKSVHGKQWVRKQDPDMAFQAALQDFIRTHTQRRLVEIDSTTSDQMLRIVRRGLADGATLDQIRDQISSVAPALSRSRAATIARTETHSAAQYGHYEAARATELPLVKEWIAADDDRTRDDEWDHVSADGQQRPMAEPFEVSGENMMQPGDPGASAGNIVNCRCGTGYLLED